MERILHVGLMLTIFLICVSSVQTIILELGLEAPFDVGTIGLTEETATEIILTDDARVTTDTVPTAPNLVGDVFAWIFVILTFIYKMAFGWIDVVSNIFRPVGLQFIGTALSGIFLFIQIITFVVFGTRIIGNFRGAS